MTPDAIDQAAGLLREATRTGTRIPPLPPECRPASPQDALAIQDALVALLGGAVAGWKVATAPDGVTIWGAILRDDCFPSPATVEVGRMPLMGIEGEVAFRFTRDLPMRDAPYEPAEIRAALAPFVAIEIVDSRFTSYAGTPFLDRLADRMSNGGMVLGAPPASGPVPPLDRLHVTARVDGTTTIDRIGGHAKGDPLLPAIEFIHAMQRRRTLEAGQFVTTGTFTGLVFGKAGEHHRIAFDDLGQVELTIA